MNSVAKPIGTWGILEEDYKDRRDPGNAERIPLEKAPWQSCAPTTEWWRRA
ncbi:MAG: hypothetical protein ACLU8D_05115 [Enterocloster sp.]